MPHPQSVLDRASFACGLAGLALVIGVTTAGAIDDDPSEDVAVLAPIGAPPPSTESTKVAQGFLDFLFGPRRTAPAPQRPRGDIVPSRDALGNPGPNYRVIGVVRNKPVSEHAAAKLKLTTLQQLRSATPLPPSRGPLLLTVSLAKQTITLYDAGVPVVTAPVSTGTKKFPTPTGVFSILEKEWWHRSNLYSAAPMPFMQRITWSGVALHAGDLPGYPASHGCVRLPTNFALHLWQTTRIGARVIITHEPVTPLPVAHAKLFAPKPAFVPEPAPLTPPEESTPAITPSSTPPVAPPENRPRPADMPVATLAPRLTVTADAPPAPQDVAKDRTADRPAARAETRPADISQEITQEITIVRGLTPQAPGGGAKVIDVAAALAALEAEPASAPDVVARAETAEDDEVDAIEEIDDPAIKATLARLEIVDPASTVINGTVEVAILRAGEPTETVLLAVEEVPETIAPPRFDAPVMLASLDAVAIPLPRRATSDAPAIAQPMAAKIKRQKPRAEPAPVAAPPRVLRPGPLSILISRKDKRMYVRKGLEPLFDVPVTIAQPHQPLGTHLFTAVGESADKRDMRWTVVTLPPGPKREAQPLMAQAPDGTVRRVRKPERVIAKPPTTLQAIAALDRLDLPPDAVARISELMSAGATLIIADAGFGRRAAAATDSDFTILTDAPSAMRRPEAVKRPPQPLFSNPG